MTSNDLFNMSTFALISCVMLSACSSPSEDEPDMTDVASTQDMATRDMPSEASDSAPDLPPDASDMIDMGSGEPEDMPEDATPDLADAGDEEDAAPDMELTCSLTCEAFDFDQEDPVTTTSSYDAATKTLTIILDEDAEEITATSVDLSITTTFDNGGGMSSGSGRNAFAAGVVAGSTLTYDLSEIELFADETLEVSNINLTLACGQNQSGQLLVTGPIDLEQSKTLDDFSCEKAPNFPF